MANDTRSDNAFERDMPGTNARTAAEAAIEELRLRGGVFVNAVRATRMPMLLTDPTLPGNPIVFANDSFLKLSGYSMEEVLGQQPHFMNGSGTDPKDAPRFQEMLRSEQDEILETVQYRKDGSPFVATVLLSAFKDDHGNTLNHFMSWLDVTRRVNAETELADLKALHMALQESEAALIKSEHRRESALIAAEMGTWEYDLVAEVCHFDARGQEMYNLPSNMLDHRPESVGPVVHPDDVGPMFDEIRKASDPGGDGRYDMVYRIARDDGTYRWLRAVGIAEFEGFGADRRAVRIVGASRDITVEREAETALRESERLRTAMLDVLPLGLALVDREGNAILSNLEWARFVPTKRIPSHTQRGPRWRTWDEDRKLVQPENFPGARALRGERVDPPMEFLFTDDDGQEIWTSVGAVPLLDADADIAGAVCFIQNIDAAKRAEEALRESEQRYRLIVENARYASIFTTDPDGLVDDWHEGASTIFGYSKEEIVGEDSRILFTVEDRQAGEPDRELQTAAATGKADNVRWHLRKDGSLVFIEGVSTALRDAKGVLIGFLKVGLDATERRRAQEHEQTLLGELQHRVRNTLAVIRSIVRRTAQTAESVEQFEQNLDGRLSSFARTQAYVTRDPQGSIDLELLVRDELLAHAAGGNHMIIIKGEPVRLGAKQAESLGLAIHELTSNAIRYGALTSDGNGIDVNWSVDANGEERVLKFQWFEHLRDRDLGQPGRSGFGTELLERVLAYELDAETKLEFRPDGFCYQADIPLSD